MCRWEGGGGGARSLRGGGARRARREGEIPRDLAPGARSRGAKSLGHRIWDSQAKSGQSRLNRDGWTLGLQTVGNAMKLSIVPSPRYFVPFYKIFYDPIRRTFLAALGAEACVHTPPAYGTEVSNLNI